jgi:hypothetical protein
MVVAFVLSWHVTLVEPHIGEIPRRLAPFRFNAAESGYWGPEQGFTVMDQYRNPAGDMSHLNPDGTSGPKRSRRRMGHGSLDVPDRSFWPSTWRRHWLHRGRSLLTANRLNRDFGGTAHWDMSARQGTLPAGVGPGRRYSLGRRRSRPSVVDRGGCSPVIGIDAQALRFAYLIVVLSSA